MLNPSASISPEVYHGDPQLRTVKDGQMSPRRRSFGLARYHPKPLTSALSVFCLFLQSSLQRPTLGWQIYLPWPQQSFLKIECAGWPRRKELVQKRLHVSMLGDRPGKAAEEPKARMFSERVSPWVFC